MRHGVPEKSTEAAARTPDIAAAFLRVRLRRDGS